MTKGIRSAGIGLKCEFTVEGAYVMAVVILSLAIILQHAYKMRDDTIAACETCKACADGVYTEDVWLKEDGTERAAAAASDRLHAIGRLKSQSISVTKEGSVIEKLTGVKAAAACTRDSRQIEIKIRDPENYMRAATLLEVFR